MLELRPNCEHCDIDLPASSDQACICTYECTFCKRCVNEVLKNVCPNCGGGFQPRPIRPKLERRKGVSVAFQKPSNKRVNTKYTTEQIEEFAKKLKDIEPRQR